MLKLAGETDIGILEAHETSLSPHLAESLPVLLKGGNLLHVPTNAGWTAVVTGSGATEQAVFYLNVNTGNTANSSALLRVVTEGFHRDIADAYAWDWAKKAYLVFNYIRDDSCATGIARFQLKGVNTIGALAAKGIGLRVDNLALVGESYGTELGEVDLATTLALLKIYQIAIVFYPGSKIEWYVNGVLKGTQSTSAKIPTGNIPDSYLVHSAENGATAAHFLSRILHPKIWQEA